MGKVIAKIKEEFLEILPAMIFFTLLFNIVTFTRSLMLQQYSIDLRVSAAATILALIVAKVIMVIDLFPFANRFKGKPVIYNVLWRTLIYSFGALVFEYLEELLPRLWGGLGFVAAHEALLADFVWQKFLAVHLWITVGLFLYCALTGVAESLGRKHFVELFLDPR